MLSTDREEFDAQLAILCAGYNVPVGLRGEAYWKALEKMGLIEFARCVEFALSAAGPEKFPTTHGLWEIRKQLRTRAAPPMSESAPPEIGKWQGYVDGLLLKYLHRRRVTEGFGGDLNLGLRRQRCREIAACFEALEAEGDPEATMADLEGKFIAAMRGIPDHPAHTARAA